MILIGRFLSPFVRRVAITLHLYELPFENHPLATIGDDRGSIGEANPQLFETLQCTALEALGERLSQLDAFQRTNPAQ